MTRDKQDTADRGGAPRTEPAAPSAEQLLLHHAHSSVPAAARDELDRFKRDVSLLEFAASKGYELDARESSTSSKVLRHSGTNDKIIIGRARDGHWQYFSVRDRDDNGTIIDFIQHRERKNLREVRKDLREWMHTDRPPQLPAAHRLVESFRKDRARVALELAQAQVVSTHAYLVDERGLDPRTLNDERFRATWKQAAGGHKNVLFLHRNDEGLCGFEIKNAGFTGFAKGGERGLWSSNARLGDRQLVITESAIDALSYHQLHPHGRTRYASTGGALSTRQSELLDHAVARMGPGSTIVAATDKDSAGHALAEHIRALCAKHPHVTFERHAPELGKDWNDQLRALRVRSGPNERDTLRDIGR